MNDLNIVHGVIVRPEGCFQGNIEIRGGKIIRVCPVREPVNPARDTVDACGLLVFPGLIDSHVHIRGGRFSYREDFASGTMAAAAGGVTTIVEMPVALPPASRKEDFAARVQEAAPQVYVDYAMYGGAGSDNLEEIPCLAKAGAMAFKTFLMPPVPGREKEFYGLCSETEEALARVMEKVAETGRLLAVHSELNQYVQAQTEKEMKSGHNGLKAFCRSRPVEAETEAVRWVITAAQKTGCRVSVCHVSTPEAICMIQEARAKGVDIHGETCPQYLLFHEDSGEHAGVFARMKPPLRDKARMEKLLGLYAEGAFELTGSDHAPYLKEEKLKNGPDIWHTYDGVPGLELSFPLLMNAVADSRLTPEAIARSMAQMPAAVLGIPGKGRIEEGADADFVLVRKLDVPKPLKITELFTKCRDSAVLYQGIPMHYTVEETYVRGKQVIHKGNITGKPGWGSFVSHEI